MHTCVKENNGSCEHLMGIFMRIIQMKSDKDECNLKDSVQCYREASQLIMTGNHGNRRFNIIEQLFPSNMKHVKRREALHEPRWAYQGGNNGPWGEGDIGHMFGKPTVSGNSGNSQGGFNYGQSKKNGEYGSGNFQGSNYGQAKKNGEYGSGNFQGSNYGQAKKNSWNSQENNGNRWNPNDMGYEGNDTNLHPILDMFVPQFYATSQYRRQADNLYGFAFAHACK